MEAALSNPFSPTPRLHSNSAELYSQTVAALEVALKDPCLRDEALEVLRGLIEKVVMHETEAGFEIELVARIVPVVALGLETPADGRKTALDECPACSAKVVTGS